MFGVLKRRFRILTHPPEYDLGVQARIPPALCALHNFIMAHDADVAQEMEDALEYDPQPGMLTGNLALGPPTAADKQYADKRREAIATEMWVSYQQLLRERGSI